MLDEAVYHVKMDFNKRFLALREVKKRVCHQLAEVQGRLRHALAALGKPTDAVADPVLKPEEMPELRDQVLDQHSSVFYSIHPCIHPFIHLSVHTSMRPAIYKSVCPSIRPTMHPGIHPSSVDHVPSDLSHEHVKMHSRSGLQNHALMHCQTL